jgi:2-dehydro-3-deoxyphosphogluconate aldolase/(4S)-4-hydroxy-2-oxoglutarate aldolase
MSTTLRLLAANPIVPVVTIDDAGTVPDLVAALVAGGIRCAEITLRTRAGVASIAAAATIPGFTVGAGTVLTPEDLWRTVDAGARFIVSPGFDDEIVRRAGELGVAVLPGVATATDVQRAVRAHLDVVKFFPADRLGGLATIAALAAPFTGMQFVPSGGVSPANAAEYLRHPHVAAISGSWMATPELIRAADFDEISRLSREASTIGAP